MVDPHHLLPLPAPVEEFEHWLELRTHLLQERAQRKRDFFEHKMHSQSMLNLSRTQQELRSNDLASKKEWLNEDDRNGEFSMSGVLRPGDSSILTDKHLRIGAGWEVCPGTQLDVDLSCLTFDAAGNILEMIGYTKLRNQNDSIIHTGDNRTGDGEGVDEEIIIDTENVPEEVQSIFIGINSFSGANLNDVDCAFARILNSKNQVDLYFEVESIGPFTAFLFIMLRRVIINVETKNGTKTQRRWELTCVAEPGNGQTLDEIGPLMKRLIREKTSDGRPIRVEDIQKGLSHLGPVLVDGNSEYGYTRYTHLGNQGVDQLSDVSLLTQCRFLQHIDVSNNMIRDITPFSTLSHLVSFTARENIISDISPVLTLPFVTFLDFRDNTIRKLVGSYKGSRLETLLLSRNGIHTLVVDGLDNLVHLDVSQNSLPTLLNLEASRLRKLIANNNNIATIGDLTRFPYLTEIDISINPIECIPEFLVKSFHAYLQIILASGIRISGPSQLHSLRNCEVLTDFDLRDNLVEISTQEILVALTNPHPNEVGGSTLKLINGEEVDGEMKFLAKIQAKQEEDRGLE